MFPCTQKLADLSFTPKGIILSGSPYSVYEEGAPHTDPAFFDLGVPILGICYGLQEIAYRLGKDNVAAGTSREYGHADLNAKRLDDQGHVDGLFAGIEDHMKCWMSHGDKLARLPEGFHTIATTANSEYAGIAHESKPIYGEPSCRIVDRASWNNRRKKGVQFHPEVVHTPNGSKLLKNFAVDICGARQGWAMSKFVDQEISRIRKLVGEKDHVLGAVSGGVDSTVYVPMLASSVSR